MFGKVVTGKSTLVTDKARSLRADSSRAEASDDETYAVDFSDISKEFGGEGMEGMAMGRDGSRGVTAMGHDFICVSLVGARWREAPGAAVAEPSLQAIGVDGWKGMCYTIATVVAVTVVAIDM